MKLKIITVNCQNDYDLIIKMLNTCYKNKDYFSNNLTLIAENIAENLKLHVRVENNTLIFCPFIENK